MDDQTWPERPIYSRRRVLALALLLQGGTWGPIRRKIGVDLFPVRRRLVE